MNFRGVRLHGDGRLVQKLAYAVFPRERGHAECIMFDTYAGFCGTKCITKRSLSDTAGMMGCLPPGANTGIPKDSSRNSNH